MTLLRYGAALVLALASLQVAYGQDEMEYIGAFILTKGTDEMDDTESVFLSTLDYDASRLRGSLNWLCAKSGSGLSIVLRLGKYYGGGRNNTVRVRYRFDNLPASKHQTWPQIGNTAAFMSGRRAEEFTEAAKEASTVLIEAVDPQDGKSNRYRYDLDGLADGLRRLPCRG